MNFSQIVHIRHSMHTYDTVVLHKLSYQVSACMHTCKVFLITREISDNASKLNKTQVHKFLPSTQTNVLLHVN